MPSVRIFAWLTVLIGVFVWRRNRVVQNSILNKSPFPRGYYANGDFEKDCAVLEDDSDGSGAFKYCEDVTFWDLIGANGILEERRAVISCDAGRKAWNTVMGPLRNPEPHGSLWVHSTGDTGNRPHRLSLRDYPAGHDFHPLGLEVYPSYAGNSSNLYVINHARARTVIEHFVLSPSEPDVAAYIRTISSPYFISPNSVALTSPDSFFVTNDHLFTRRLPLLGHVIPILETILAIPVSFVSHVTLAPHIPGMSAAPITSHSFSMLFTSFANGVAISPSKNELAVVSTSLNQIHFYGFDSRTRSVTGLTETIDVPFSPDNIAYDDTSALLVAGHPHFPSLVSVAANKTSVVTAPSWAISIERKAGGGNFDNMAPISASSKVPASLSHEIETIFQSDGTGFSSSSTALRDSSSGSLYVSGLYADPGVILCRPKVF
ncbi:hypothetical protein BD779DRAFT_1495698 [Infundibulicybe gibba]|nr:hypothetical protein BD779DRAFT_1495698 [Infundibulicybe gibba]